MKYVLAVIVLLLALAQLVRKLRAGLRSAQDMAGYKLQQQDAQAMVPCHACGVHIPQREAVYRSGLAYCCDAHACNAGQTASSAASSGERKRV